MSGDRISVELVGSGDANAVKTQLTALDMQHVESAGSYFTGDIALGSLNQLASMSSLVFARPGLQPITIGRHRR